MLTGEPYVDGPFLGPLGNVLCVLLLHVVVFVSVLSLTAAAFVLLYWLLRKWATVSDDWKDNAILNSREQTMRGRCYL